MNRAIHLWIRAALAVGFALPLAGLWSPAAAQFDFVGDASPSGGSEINTTVSDSVAFEVSVFDDGRTNLSSTERAPGIGALVRWREKGSSADFSEAEMAFDRKGGPFGPNNDIFRLSLPLSTFAGVDSVEWRAFAVDSTAGNLLQEASQDKNGSPPPFVFTFSGVLLTDVDVTFQLCTNGIDSMLTKFDGEGGREPFDPSLPICIAGSTSELGSFGTEGPVLQRDGNNPDYFTATVTFPAGGAETIKYKYRVNGCDLFELEGIGNDRAFTLDYTEAAVTLPLDLLDDVESDPASSTCGGTPVKASTWSGIKAVYGHR